LIELGLSPDYIGFIFAGACLFYAVSAPLVGYLTNHFSKESLTLFAYILSGLALIIQGPSKFLGLDESLKMTISGFIFLGGMEAFIFVPLMPILIESLMLDFKQRNTAFKKLSEKDNDQVEELMTDKASSIFQGAQAIGCIIGPILGGFLNDLYKFQTTCDIMSFTCLLYAVFLYVIMFNDPLKVVKIHSPTAKSEDDSNGLIEMTDKLKS
jgi:MFS family permease